MTRPRIDSITIRWEQDDHYAHCAGVVAIAEVSYPIGQGNKRLERLSSGGLWGIERPEQGRAHYETEQLDDLRDHL